MANYTPNYQLHQWEPEDKFLRTDFNQDLSRIDTALDGLADKSAALEAAAALCGNCQIVSGSYMGSGQQGQANPNILTFNRIPRLVAILPENTSDSSVKSMLMIFGSKIAYTYAEYYNSCCAVSWTDTSVSWSNNASADYQFNSYNIRYHYVALLDSQIIV